MEEMGGASWPVVDDPATSQRATGGFPVDAPQVLDRLYNEVDRLYNEVARGCGISECAYWLLYGVEAGDGCATQAELAQQYSYSKQTVNSALKTLEAKGLVTLAAREGGRGKVIRLTKAGREFSQRHIVPAMEAERRAFASLAPRDRSELIRLVRAYTLAVDAELGVLLGRAPRSSVEEVPGHGA